MKALTTRTFESEGSPPTEPGECENEPLTATNNANPERCANPLCAKPITIKAQRGKRYCSDHCRMDGYALKRAKTLLNRVGILRFHELMDKV